MLLLPLASGGTAQARAEAGIATQIVASFSAIEGESQMVVERIVVDPGVLLAQQSYPGPAIFVVVSGTLQTTLIRGGAAVRMGGSEPEVEIGATMNLSEGQVITYSPGAVTTMANRRHEPLVLMVMVLSDGTGASSGLASLLSVG
jgi:quercetin dioxygenase-like cupin family protein